MFDEVRISRLFRTFVARACIHPETYRDGFDGRDSLGDQANPVLEDDLAVQVLPTRWIWCTTGGWCWESLFSTQADFPLLVDFKHLDLNLIAFRNLI